MNDKRARTGGRADGNGHGSADGNGAANPSGIPTDTSGTQAGDALSGLFNALDELIPMLERKQPVEASDIRILKDAFSLARQRHEEDVPKAVIELDVETLGFIFAAIQRAGTVLGRVDLAAPANGPHGARIKGGKLDQIGGGNTHPK